MKILTIIPLAICSGCAYNSTATIDLGYDHFSNARVKKVHFAKQGGLFTPGATVILKETCKYFPSTQTVKSKTGQDTMMICNEAYARSSNYVQQGVASDIIQGAALVGAAAALRPTTYDHNDSSEINGGSNAASGGQGGDAKGAYAKGAYAKGGYAKGGYAKGGSSNANSRSNHTVNNGNMPMMPGRD